MTLLNAHITGDRGIIEGKFDEIFDLAKAKRLLRDAVDDIGDAIEQQVQRTVPVDSGTLKLHPLDRDDTRIGFAKGISAFGGGVSIRGAGGRFVGAVPADTPFGELIARSTITLPQEPEHAIWVHDGTGIYGPREHVIVPRKATFMVFHYPKAYRPNKHFRLRTVKGQKPQPYLDNAFLLINRSYIPARIQLLRAQIAAET